MGKSGGGRKWGEPLEVAVNLNIRLNLFDSLIPPKEEAQEIIFSALYVS